MRSPLLVSLVGLLLWAAAVPASAQTDDDLAREHFRAGRAYFERAQYAEAAQEFEESYRLSQRPALLHNISRAYELDGELPQAIEAIDRWLATDESSADPDARAAAESRRGRLAAELELQRQEQADAEERAAEEAARPPMSPMRVGGLYALAGAGAMAVGAVVTGVVALRKHDSLTNACPDGVCPPDRAGDIQRGRRLANTSTALTVGAGAAAVAGVLLYLLGADERQQEGTHVEVSAGPGEIRGGVRVTF